MSRCRRLNALVIFMMVLSAALAQGFAYPSGQAPAPPQAQISPSDEQVWKAFIAWFKAAPAVPDVFRLYGEELARQGVTREETERRFGIIMRLFATRPEGAEVFYDKTFARPALTGKPEEDGFASAPSEFLMGSVKDVAAGRALDLGMGQGRNAVALAAKGWSVTGVDVSGEAVAAAAKNAEKAGVKITGIKSDYASFDLGRESWDLVAMIFAWAPIDEAAFVERVRASLKPGGLVVFENFVSTPEQPRAPMVRALPPGATRTAFAGFDIVSYEELTDTGDWGGPGSRLVRMVARKR
jgi:2-polyprenyl-3-methyl-5-hydroxy-6-metoxy-1,4-benzoquinol methylase